MECVFSPVSFWTDAGISVDGIDALTSVLTLVLFTVVKVHFTVLTHVARCALTPATQLTSVTFYSVDGEVQLIRMSLMSDDILVSLRSQNTL